MPDTEVLAMEVPQYVGDGHRTLVPRIVGRTSAAERTKATTGNLFAQYLREASPDTRAVHQRLSEWVLARGGEAVEAPTSMGYHAGGHFLVRLYPRDECVELSLSRWRGGDLGPEAQAIRAELVRICQHRKLAKKALYPPPVDLIAHWQKFIGQSCLGT